MATTAASLSSSSSSSEPQEAAAEDDAAAAATSIRANARPQSRLWLQNFPDVKEHTSPRQLADDVDNNNNHKTSSLPAIPVVTPLATSTIRSPSILPLKPQNALNNAAADANLASAPLPPPSVTTGDIRRRSSGANFNRTQYSTISGQLWRRASGDIASVVDTVTSPLANVENAEAGSNEDDKEQKEIIRKVTFDIPASNSNSNDGETKKVRRESMQSAQTQAGALRRISMFPHHYRHNPSSSEQSNDEKENEEATVKEGEVVKIDGRTILTLNGARLPSIGTTADSTRWVSNESVEKRGSFLVEEENGSQGERKDELHFYSENKIDVENAQADLFVVGDGEEDNQTIFENIPLYSEEDGEVEVMQGEEVSTSQSQEDDENAEQQDTLEELEELDHVRDEVDTTPGTTKKPRPLSEIVFTQFRNDSNSSIGDNSLSDSQDISKAVDPTNANDPTSTTPVIVRSSRASHLHRNSQILKQTIPEEPNSTLQATTPPNNNINHEAHLVAFAPSLGTAAASHKRLSKLHDVSNIVKSSEVFAEDSVYLHDIRHRPSSSSEEANNNDDNNDNDNDLLLYLRQYALQNRASSAVDTTRSSENNHEKDKRESSIGLQDVALMTLPSEKAAAVTATDSTSEAGVEADGQANITSRASISSTASKRSSWYCSSLSIRSSIASSSGGNNHNNNTTDHSSSSFNGKSRQSSSNRWSAGSSSNISPRTSYIPNSKKRHTTRSSVYIAGKPVFSSAYYRDEDYEHDYNDEDGEGYIYHEKEVDENETEEEEERERPSDREIKLQRENDYLRNRVLELEKHLDVALKHALNSRRDGEDGDDDTGDG